MNDFTIIGSGAGGLSSAYELAKKKYSVEIYEEGDFLNIETNSQKENKVSSIMLKYWRNGGFNPVVGNSKLVISEGVGVGGSTLINGGVIGRVTDELFEDWKNNHGFDLLTKEELLEIYLDNEKKLNVSNRNVFGNQDSNLLANNAKKLNFSTRLAGRAVINCKNHNRCPFGCTSGAKQSLDRVFLKELNQHNFKLYNKSKLVKIITKKNLINEIVIYDIQKKKNITKKIKNLILSVGSIQSPKVLMKNNLIKKDNNIQFHANIKILVTFKSLVDSYNSTILSKHVDQFEKDGVLFMTSNFIDSINAASLTSYNFSDIKNFIMDRNKSAIFNAQIKLNDSFIETKKFINSFYNTFTLSENDFKKIKYYLLQLLKIIYQSEVDKIYLPFFKSGISKSYIESCKIIKNSSVKNIFMNSVHLMSSNSISSKIKNNYINESAQLKKYENCYIIDASILPTNLGQHPQNTIMALSRALIKKNF